MVNFSTVHTVRSAGAHRRNMDVKTRDLWMEQLSGRAYEVSILLVLILVRGMDIRNLPVFISFFFIFLL